MWRIIEKPANMFRRLMGRIIINPDKPLPPPLPGPVSWIHYRYFRRHWEVCRGKWLEKETKIAKANYPKQIERIKAKVLRGEKINVIFLVVDLAKWKAASVYFEMQRDKRFDPVIGVSIAPFTIGHVPRATQRRIDETDKWFSDRGYKTIRLYDALKDRLRALEPFKPDIVFYPEVWYSALLHFPSRVSRFALTAYIPYFVPNYVDVHLDCQQRMHRLYWRHFVLNDALADLYRMATSDRLMAGEFIGLGHPMFDRLSDGVSLNVEGRKTVIFAPHWTIDHPNNHSRLKYSTFTETAMPILEYAKCHPEFDWVFKPHPRLYEEVIRTGFMTKDAADNYYSAWGKIGSVCQEGDYMRLFQNSFAMITDCGSFLSEYGATGRPLIHLISRRNNVVPPKPIKSLYDTYYKVHNLSELGEVFADVLEKGNDRKREARISAARNLSIVGRNSARNIIRYILGELGLE